MSDADWLEGDADETRQMATNAALEHAQLFLVFEETERGRALLEYWDRICIHHRTPVNAPITQYAADEARREFVAGIHRNLDLLRQSKT